MSLTLDTLRILSPESLICKVDTFITELKNLIQEAKVVRKNLSDKCGLATRNAMRRYIDIGNSKILEVPIHIQAIDLAFLLPTLLDKDKIKLIDSRYNLDITKPVVSILVAEFDARLVAYWG